MLRDLLYTPSRNTPRGCSLVVVWFNETCSLRSVLKRDIFIIIKTMSGKSVRKTIFLSESLYKETSFIASNLGLNYAEYIRRLLSKEVDKMTGPPELPKKLKRSEILAYEPSNFIGFKKRQDLIKVVQQMRRIIWDS